MDLAVPGGIMTVPQPHVRHSNITVVTAIPTTFHPGTSASLTVKLAAVQMGASRSGSLRPTRFESVRLASLAPTHMNVTQYRPAELVLTTVVHRKVE